MDVNNSLGLIFFVKVLVEITKSCNTYQDKQTIKSYESADFGHIRRFDYGIQLILTNVSLQISK